MLISAVVKCRLFLCAVSKVDNKEPGERERERHVIWKGQILRIVPTVLMILRIWKQKDRLELFKKKIKTELLIIHSVAQCFHVKDSSEIKSPKKCFISAAR